VSSVDGRNEDAMDDEPLAELNEGDSSAMGCVGASNEWHDWHADFRELFETISEGDYLIGGASACSIELPR